MSRGRLVITLLVAAATFAVLVALGTWQMQRLHWKEALVAEVSARSSLEPVPAPARDQWAALDVAEWEYRRVTAEGRFRVDGESRLYALLGEAKGDAEGPGYWIMTPLELRGGGTVLVNRGFVPLQGNVTAPYRAPPEGEVVVAGLLRGPEDSNPFTPEDKPADRLFYVRNASVIANALGLRDAAPFTIDQAADAQAGFPQGGETRLTFTNRHLEYALTWYGLAGALAGVLVALLWRQRRAA
jgi:surfeit locus 1 family protein